MSNILILEKLQGADDANNLLSNTLLISQRNPIFYHILKGIFSDLEDDSDFSLRLTKSMLNLNLIVAVNLT